MQYPNIKFKVISSDPIYNSDRPVKESLTDLVEKEQPDLLFLTQYQQQILQETNALMPLKALLDSSVLENMPQGVRDLLGYYGDGDFNSVAEVFSSEALFYNKKLFEQFSIPVPDGSMSWADFSNTARRFTNTDVLGLYTASMDPSVLFVKMGLSDGLSYLNKDKTHLTMNTDGWTKLAETVKSMYMDGVVNKAASASDNDFISGSAAMTIAQVGLYEQLVSMKVPFEWGVVPLPASDHSKIPIDLAKLIAVNKNSVNGEAAASIIEFIMSDPAIAANSRASTSLLPTAVATSTDYRESSNPLNFMYTLSANININEQHDRLQSMPEDFIQSFFPELTSRMGDIIRGEIDSRSGLMEVESYGNTLLQALKAK